MFKYDIDRLMFKELREKAVVPKFQRKLVWSKSEKRSFIDTLSNGHPFGAILIYKYEEDEKYSIIDGLQRFTTIQDYISNPEEYISFEDIVEKIFDSFFDSESIPPTTADNLKHKINGAILSFVKQMDKDNSTRTFYRMLKEATVIGFENFEAEDFFELEKITNQLLKNVKDHLNVDNLPIPTIIFTGDVEELATVFENLNRGGKKLSKYQVFAAQWSKHELKLSDQPLNKRILKITINRYEELIESRNVEIKNFNREEMLENKTINIAEFCYALGYLILEKMSVFWNKDNEDTANQIGYSSLAIIFGVKNNNMNTLINYFDKLNDSDLIESVVREVLNIYREINDRFEKVFKIPGIHNKFYGGRTATDFQLLSFFGSLWHTKYGDLKDGELDIIPRYRTNYNIIERNLIKSFIYDVVIERWRGSGDSRLDNIILEGNNYYLKGIDKDRFEQALLNWHEEIIVKSNINFEPVSKMLYTVLTSFYQHKYDEKNYDSEHIIPRKYINRIRNKSNRPIPGGTIGNHMYLDVSNNRSKKELSLYDVKKAGFKLKEDFLNFQIYPTESEFNEVKYEINRDNGDYDKLINIIVTRGKHLLYDLVNKLYD